MPMSGLRIAANDIRWLAFDVEFVRIRVGLACSVVYKTPVIDGVNESL